MVIRTATFVKSSPDVSSCPPPTLPEYAFIGRSNVGKSSLLNMLTGHKSLAKTSSTPGKTQLINHFEINGTWYLVDLPGYGYAKVPKGIRKQFSQIINGYTLKRENLHCLFVLIDSRLEPQKVDLAFIKWLGEEGVPFALVFTKSDKLGSKNLADNVENYKTELLKSWEELPNIFISSAQTQKGREELLSFIDSVNNSNISE